MKNHKILSGTLITLLGSLMYVLFGFASQFAGQTVAVSTLIFWQCCAGLLLSSALLTFKRVSLRTVWQSFHAVYLGRITISLVSIYTFIAGLQHVSVYNALVIINCCPFLMPLLRFVCFDKPINPGFYRPLVIAFIGIILILGPDRGILSLPILLIVVSMICMAVSVLLLEHRSNTNGHVAIFYYFFIGTLITAAVTFILQDAAIFSWPAISKGLLTGGLFFLVQVCLIIAARFISTALMAVLFYSEVVISLVISLATGMIAPSMTLGLGTVLVLAAGLYVVQLESRQSDTIAA